MSDILAGEELRLLELKAAVVDGMAKMEDGFMQAVIAVYCIREENVWGHDGEFLDYCHDEGVKPTWNNWIVWFSNELDFKRTILLDYVSAVRILIGGCGMTLQDIDGADVKALVQIKQYLDYSRNTGELLGGDQEVIERLPPGEDLGERVGKFVQETYLLPSPGERAKRVEEVVNGPDHEPILPSVFGPDDRGRYNLVLSIGNRRYMFGRDAIPSNIIERFCKQKRIPVPKEEE